MNYCYGRSENILTDSIKFTSTDVLWLYPYGRFRISSAPPTDDKLVTLTDVFEICLRTIFMLLLRTFFIFSFTDVFFIFTDIL